jgi:hypothetical protein
MPSASSSRSGKRPLSSADVGEDDAETGKLQRMAEDVTKQLQVAHAKQIGSLRSMAATMADGGSHDKHGVMLAEIAGALKEFKAKTKEMQAREKQGRQTLTAAAEKKARAIFDKAHERLVGSLGDKEAPADGDEELSDLE